MFKIAELLVATQGKLIQGSGNAIVKGISIDSRTIKSGEAFIAIKGSNFDGHCFIEEAIKRGASCIIIEPSRNKPQARNTAFIEVKDTIKALGDIASFKRKKFDLAVIAITGSSGKTTTKEMVASVLSKRLKVLKNEGTKNNHIGVPLTLLKLNSSYDAAVLELGTNHFKEIEHLARICQPNVGIIINIGPAHLEYFHNLAGIFKEKYSLIKNLKAPHLCLLNADDVLLRKPLIKKIKQPVMLGFGIKNNTDFFASDIKLRLAHSAKGKSVSGKIEFLVNQKYKFTIDTFGYYNVYNALVAIAVARIFGLGYSEIRSRLASFGFPQGRLNFKTMHKINFIDDTYNSNPDSLKEALSVLQNLPTDGRKIFVMGDMLELGNREKFFHRRAGRQAAAICDILITAGELSKVSAKAARASGLDIKNIFTCESSQEAGDILLHKISPRKGDIVLVKGSRLMKMEEVFKP